MFSKFDKQTDCDSTEYYDKIKRMREINNYYHADLNTAYEEVENYIRRHDKILVGGMSIEMSLKAKGDKLYETVEIDYDFITPTHFIDAYNIGNNIAEKLTDISIINGKHSSTMRVRYKYQAVADVTYVPKNIYDKIGFYKYNGFRVIHPHYQMLDQLRAMHRLAEGPPLEPYTGTRLEKDSKRFTLLYKYYPIIVKKADKYEMKTHTVKTSQLKGACLGGFAAVAYWLNKLKIPNDFKFKADKQQITCEIPIQYNMAIFSNDVEHSIELFPNAELKKVYRPFLDKLPQLHSYDLVDIYDTYGEKILITEESNYNVISLYGSILWIMIKWLFDQDNSACAWVEKLLHMINKDFTTDCALFPRKPVFYGDVDWAKSYLYALKKQGNADVSTLLPHNAYLSKGEKVKAKFLTFNPELSEFLCYNGEPIDIKDDAGVDGDNKTNGTYKTNGTNGPNGTDDAVAEIDQAGLGDIVIDDESDTDNTNKKNNKLSKFSSKSSKSPKSDVSSRSSKSPKSSKSVKSTKSHKSPKSSK
jgi:hypothetical protein